MSKKNLMKVFAFSLFLLPFNSYSQEEQAGPSDSITKTKTEVRVPQEVTDQEITNRLKKIFNVTGWYPNVEIETVEGVVFISGEVSSFEKKDWALELINKTDGVVAVVNKIGTALGNSNFLKPAKDEALDIYTNSTKILPYIASAFLILIVFMIIGVFAKKVVNAGLRKKGTNKLLTKTLTSLTGLSLIVIGVYFALKTSGLSTLAMTLLGGTGLIGLGIGLALKNIFENYASSLMISMKELLRIDELVNIDGFEGVVQSVTTRGTTLMDYDGNNIIIPNNQVFNSVIKNYSRNPNMRLSFTIGIGYDDSIDAARGIIKSVLTKMNEHIKSSPEPMIVVDNLGASTVNLKGYFWIDSRKSSSLKVKSLALKKIKEALIEAEISMPDDAREVVFASPLEIKRIDEQVEGSKPLDNDNRTSEKPEGLEDMSNEIQDLKEQARTSPDPNQGENLI